MSCRSSATRWKISRIFLLLLLAGLVKLAVFGVMGVEKLTMVASEAVAQTEQAEQEPAPEPVADPDSEQAAEAMDEAGEGSQDVLEDTVMETKPAGMDESDWRILKQREEELAAKERNLNELEAQLDAKTQELEALNARLRALLDEVKAQKDERLQKLVKAYANMKAKSAAAVLETMDTGLAVKILAGLGGRQAGEILGFIETRRAAQLSEALTQLRVPFEE